MREAVAAALRDLGFQLTRTGIRRGASDVDRLLLGSAAKPIALVEVLGAEAEARGTGLRALVLCDAELTGARPDGELRGILDPAAGTARRAVRALADDMRTAVLRPLLVSGRGLRCAEDADAAAACPAAGARGGAPASRGDAAGWSAGAGGGGSSSCAGPATGARGAGSRWPRPRSRRARCGRSSAPAPSSARAGTRRA